MGAVDDPSEGGLWYYTAPKIADRHAAGVRGQGITVAIIDGPVYAESPDLVGANFSVHEESFCDIERDGGFGLERMVRQDSVEAEHATALASLIVGTGAGVNGQPGIFGVAPDASVRLYVHAIQEFCGGAYADDSFADAIDQAVADGADIISMSFGSNAWDEESIGAITRAQRAGVILVAAAGHLETTDAMAWPAAFNGVVVVEAAGVDRLSPRAVSDPLLTVVAPGVDIRVLAADSGWQEYYTTTGSSLATAWTAGVLALAWSAHPDATANQMIQALLRTSGQSEGEIVRVDDNVGYGQVRVFTLVETDPTRFPDENPLLRDGERVQPTTEEILGIGPSASPEVTDPADDQTEATPTPTAAPVGDAESGVSATVLIVSIAVAAVVLAGIITAVLLTRRRTTAAGPESSVPSV